MGTDQDLQDLTAELHSRGMFIMVDFNVNDLSIPTGGNDQDSTYSSLPSPWDVADAFHLPPCEITYSNDTNIQNCWFSTSAAGSLPDVKSEVPKYYDPFVQSVVDHVNHFAIDGIRMDVARLIPKPQLNQFQQAVGCFVTGLVADSNFTYVYEFQTNSTSSSNVLDSVLDYPMYYEYNSSFHDGGSMSDVAYGMYAETLASDQTCLTNFLDNHDLPRMASYTQDIVKEYNAITLNLLTLGIPIVYYGWEQRFDGAQDPDNREPLWTSNYDTSAPLYQYIAKLHAIRNKISTFDSSFYSRTGLKSAFDKDEVLHFQRGAVYVIANNLGGTADISDPSYFNVKTNTVFNQDTSNPNSSPNTDVVDLVTCQPGTAGPDGSFDDPGAPSGFKNYPRVSTIFLP
ncbi:MAG: hypothetical protein Q9227_005317 [Pyrenula ochraceoflavens]